MNVISDKFIRFNPLHLGFIPLMEHRLLTKDFQLQPSVIHTLDICLPFLEPHVMQSASFSSQLRIPIQELRCNVVQWFLQRVSYPIPVSFFNFLLSWFVLCHSRLLLMVSDQQIHSILCRQLFKNTYTFLEMAIIIL